MDHMVVHRIQGGKGWIREHKTSLQGKVTEPLSYAVHRSFQFLLLLLRNRLLIQRKLLHFLHHQIAGPHPQAAYRVFGSIFFVKRKSSVKNILGGARGY